MGEYPSPDAYVPDAVSDEELAYYEKGKMGGDMGWGDSPAVLVVDMTKAFVSDEYASGRTETGQPAVEANAELLERAREAGFPIFYTTLYDVDTVPESYLARDGETLGDDRRAIHDEGNDVVDALKPQEDDIVIQKPAPSAFFDTNLSSMLTDYGIDTLVVTGMSTSGCVRASVVDAASSNYNVIVPIECAADRCPTSHEISLFDMDMKWADVRPLDWVIDTIEGRDPVPADD